MSQLPAEQAIQRFKENEERVNAFVNQEGHYTTNEASPREVETLPSFMGRMHDRYSGFNVRGDWTTSTAYQVQDLVESGGIVYMSLEAHTSGTFATDLASGKWAIYQGITAAQLADTTDPTKGAGYLGHTYPPSSTGVELPGKPLTIIVRSSPIPLQSAITSNMVSDGSVDYSLQFQAAINYLRDYGGGRIILPPNKIIKASNLKLYSGVEIFGHDWTTIIDVEAENYGFSINPGSEGTSDITQNARNIALRGFKIRGKVVASGFSEHKHLLNFNAASWVEVEQMNIEGFRGDGIYLGSSNAGGLERHNSNIRILGGRIDGVNNDNRNGVSVIDCDGLLIEGVEFRNVTRSNMPGAVDIEPDAAIYHTVKDITVRRNKFKDIGGNVGVMSLVLPNVAYTVKPRKIKFEDNEIKETSVVSTAGFAVVYVRDDATVDSADQIDFVAEGNTVIGASRPFTLFGLRGGKLCKNTYTTGGTALIGYTSAAKCKDILLENETFDRCGSASGVGVQCFTVSGLKVVQSRFIDCGQSGNSSSYALNFSQGSSDNVQLIENEFTSPNNLTVYSVHKEATHTFDAKTNRFYNNNRGNFTHNFEAFVTDDCGNVINGATALTFNFGTLPDTFPVGESTSLINGDTTGPAGTGGNQGILKTYRQTTTSGYEKFTYQEYFHANNTTKKGSFFVRRRQQSSNAWDSWYEQVGT